MSDEAILIVDDNPLNLKVVQLLLTAEGYAVRTAASAEEALRALETFRPGLILTDLQLPGLDGLELTRRLKADPDRRHIPVVALTAYAMKGDETKARAAGCDGYIAKPINTRTLPAVLADYLKPIPAKEITVVAQPDPRDHSDHRGQPDHAQDGPRRPGQ